jgi:hypothetical protein
MAAGALQQGNRDTLGSDHPANIRHRAVGERIDLALGEVRRRAQLTNQVTVIAAAGNEIKFVEDAPAGFDPFARRLQFPGLDQRFGADAVQEIPVALGLATGRLNRVRAEVLHRRAVVLLFGEMPGGEFLSRDRELPTLKSLLVPDARDMHLRGECGQQ